MEARAGRETHHHSIPSGRVAAVAVVDTGAVVPPVVVAVVTGVTGGVADQLSPEVPVTESKDLQAAVITVVVQVESALLAAAPD
jgi:hypothetical protein